MLESPIRRAVLTLIKLSRFHSRNDGQAELLRRVQEMTKTLALQRSQILEPQPAGLTMIARSASNKVYTSRCVWPTTASAASSGYVSHPRGIIRSMLDSANGTAR